MAVEKRVRTACQGWGCHEQCMLETIVVDGKIVRTERSFLAGVNREDSRICHKGIVSGGFPYLKERLTHPLKRVGERGEGKFEEVSWDEAMNDIAARINEAREKYGAESIVVNPFICGYPGLYSSMGYLLENRFVNLFGATMLQNQAADTSSLFTAVIDYNTPDMLVSDPNCLHEAKNIIIWAGNPIGFTRAAYTSKVLMDAQERGVKITDIGLIFDNTAAKADLFVPINPGTDVALALAMIHFMMDNNFVDEEYTLSHTVAPFLVRNDNGKFLRASDLAEGGAPTDYVCWDKISQSTCTVAPKVKSFGDAIPELYAEVTVNGIACKTVLQIIKERVADFTLESQVAITGVPAQVAEQIITEYCTIKPSTLYIYYGMRYANGFYSQRALNIIAALSGNMRYKGGAPIFGGMPNGHTVLLNDANVIFPKGYDVPSKMLFMATLLESFKNPDVQQYKVFINAMGNPVQNWPNYKLWAEKVFPNFDLIVSLEVRMTDTARFADYVLPEATIFERTELIAGNHDCIVLSEPAIDPVGQSKVPTEIWHELAKRVGLGEYFPAETETFLNMRLEDGDPGFTNITPRVTLERLKEEKVIRFAVEEAPFDPFSAGDFLTESGRIEIYREALAGSGGATTFWVEPHLAKQDKEKYPLQLFPGRHKYYMQGQFTEFAELRVLGGKVSTVALNPRTAHEYGLKQGDWVEVYTERGSCKALLTLSEGFPPGMAHLWYSYQTIDYPDGGPTMIESEQNTDESADPVMIEWSNYRRATSKQEGMPEILDYYVHRSSELFWDDRCNIRKAKEV